MIRQIIIPKKKIYQLEIPESLIGKRIELIAFEIEEPEKKESWPKISKEELYKKFEGFTFNSEGQYFFSREEASDYE